MRRAWIGTTCAFWIAGSLACKSDDGGSSGGATTTGGTTSSTGDDGSGGETSSEGDTSGDETTSTSSTEEGTTPGETSSSSTTPPAECGNGEVEGDEQCDDGNDVDDDDCSNDCLARCGIIWGVSNTDLSDTRSIGWGIATDADGNIIAGGHLEDANEKNDGWVGKHTTDGDLTWSGDYVGADDDDDTVAAVAIDGDGNVIIAGTTVATATGEDIFVRKLDPDGTELWTETFDGAASEDDWAAGVATNADGEILVSGTARVGDGDTDLWVRKYDAGGTEVWTETYNGTSLDAYSLDDGGPVAVDLDGNVLVMGRMRVDYQTNDWVLIKYGPDGGAPVWANTVNVEQNNLDPYPEAVAADSSGNVVITYSWMGPTSGSHRFLVFKYDPDGTELWTTDPETLEFEEYGAYTEGLAIDSQDNIVFAGFDGEYERTWVMGLDPDGALLCLRYEPPGAYWQVPYFVAVDHEDNIVVTGEEYDPNAGTSDLWIAKFRR